MESIIFNSKNYIEYNETFFSSLKKDKIPTRITKHFFKMKRNNKSKIDIKSFLF